MMSMLVIAGVGILALIAEIINMKRWLTLACALGLIAALYFSPIFYFDPFHLDNMVRFDAPAIAFTWLIVVIAILWLWMSGSYLREGAHQTDKTALVMFVVLGGVIMASFANMAMLFLGLEILSLSLYALAGSRKDSLSSIEAAFKYFLLGSFATGFLLFGITLVYGATGSFEISAIAESVSVIYAQEGVAADPSVAPGFMYAGILLILVGLVFKLSAVPFHFWAPDVYDGSPTPITALMATVVKIAAFAAFWRLFSSCFGGSAWIWGNVLYAITLLTLTVPNITAVYQPKVKRMLAYSSISHVGFILLAFISDFPKQPASDPTVAVYYLLGYTIASLAAFSVLDKVEKNGNSFAGLYYRNPLLAVTISIALMSMAGIPPLAGFVGKFNVLLNAVSLTAPGFSQSFSLAVVLVAIAMSAVSAYYYFKLIVTMFVRDGESSEIRISLSERLFSLAMIILIIGLGVYFPLQALHSFLGY